MKLRQHTSTLKLNNNKNNDNNKNLAETEHSAARSSQKDHTYGRDHKNLPYLLIYHNADGALGDIPDNTGAAMVELVRHSLMHGTVHLDVHIVANLVVAKVRGQVDVSFMPERTREQIPGPRSQPMTGRHDCYLVSIFFSFSSYCSFLPHPFATPFLQIGAERKTICEKRWL